MAMTIADASHLLRRAGFGGTNAQVTALAALDRPVAVDQLLNATGLPEAPPAIFSDTSKGDYEYLIGLVEDWLKRMATSPAPIQEKMTLFWHGHFVSSIDKVGSVFLMYEQQKFYRQNALGNFRTLTQGMATQVAMLRYLDNDSNVKGRPNQNFARELLELFTLGIGNYAESDVIDGARAWTGHNVNDDGSAYMFRSGSHDTGNKTIFGITKNWDGPDEIDEIVQRSKQPIMARYIAKKLWEFFAHPGPPAGVVDALATEFISSGLSVKALLRALFLRDEFYATAAKQGLVRTPVEWAVTALKSLQLNADDVDLKWHLGNQGHEPFSPPNVAGWKQNGYWISTSESASKAAFAWHFLDRTNERRLMPDYTQQTVANAVQQALDKFAVSAPSAVTRAALTTWLTGVRAATDYFGDQNYDLLFLVLMSPDLVVA
jgi:uncharacterized protein (DUF1800 family)